VNAILLSDEAATERFGTLLAYALQPGDIVALSGDLGAGKTTLARGVLKALGLEGEAPSPTFAIVQPYEPPEVRLPVWHVDLYRLEDAGEAAELGLDEAREQAALLIEWPERLGSGLSPDALRLRLEIGEGGARRLTADVPPAWEERWPLDRSR
jgi:tRNA threonylcarbamoyladenosine biosynthesis protein TsaE